MIEVGVYKAKTQLASLLAKVQQGEEVVITRRGRPVARLSSYEGTASPTADDDIVAKFREARKGVTLGDLSIKDLIEEGRR